MYDKALKAIYEMDSVVVTEHTANYNRPGSTKVIGRVEEYDCTIEIMFEDDDVISISKANIKEIDIHDSMVIFYFKNGDDLIFESE